MRQRTILGFILVGAFLMAFPELKDPLGFPRYLLTF